MLNNNHENDPDREEASEFAGNVRKFPHNTREWMNEFPEFF